MLRRASGYCMNQPWLTTSDCPVSALVGKAAKRRATAATSAVVVNSPSTVSFSITCRDQSEVDYYWHSLADGGEESVCGWLKDRFGLSWQVVPAEMEELYKDENSPGAQRVMEAMLKMKKLDIAELNRAYAGEMASV